MTTCDKLLWAYTLSEKAGGLVKMPQALLTWIQQATTICADLLNKWLIAKQSSGLAISNPAVNARCMSCGDM